MGFYSHNLKTWVSVCTLCWNENFVYGNYHIGGYLNFTGIHVISKKNVPLRNVFIFLHCSHNLLQMGWDLSERIKEKIMLFLQLLPYVSVFSDAWPCNHQTRKNFSCRAIENLGSEIYKGTVHLVLYLRHFSRFFYFHSVDHSQRKEHKLLMADSSGLVAGFF